MLVSEKMSKFLNVAAVCVLAAGAVFVANSFHNKKISSFKESIENGSIELVCHIGSEYKSIPADKLKDIDFDNGVFVFVNGSAKSCVVNQI